MEKLESSGDSDSVIKLKCRIPANVQVLRPLQGAALELVEGQESQVSAADVASTERTQRHKKLDISALNEVIAKSVIVHHTSRSTVLRLSASVAMKAGPQVDVSHVTTLNYIKGRAPCIPMPENLGCLVSDSANFLFMTFFQGQTLEDLWINISTAQKLSIKNQLHSIFEALRKVPEPDLKGGQSVLGGGTPRKCRDMRRWSEKERVAETPIFNETEFNHFLTSHSNSSDTAWIQRIRSSMRNDHNMVMSHGDLHPRNVIVQNDPNSLSHHGSDSLEESTETCDGDIKVVAICEWERSGWYPEYWEFAKALSCARRGRLLTDWWECLPSSIGPWPTEYGIDSLISHWLDEANLRPEE